MRQSKYFDVKCPNCRGDATLQVVYDPSEALCMNWFTCDACDQKSKNVNFHERCFDTAAVRAMKAFEEMARRERWESPREVTRRRNSIKPCECQEPGQAECGTKVMPARKLFGKTVATGSLRSVDEPENPRLRLSDSLRADIDRFYRASVTQEVARNG